MAKIQKLLIANRGEIACRIMRTCQRLGIKSVAVYSEADAKAMHVRYADEAYLLGPSAAKDSYLNGEKIIQVAKEIGADAIHPGYGFLSENHDFAKAVEAAGLIFIGPQPEAMQAMGDKASAKALMAKAGVPMLPGYHGEKQDKDFLKAQAKEVGYPVLLKAAYGGGGRGMRLVEKAADFEDAYDSAKREAASSFGQDQLIVEKYLASPRHIEVQIFGDGNGNVVHLFERDCSLQRRHQKVVEEAPAPNLTDKQRKDVCEAAVKAGEAVHYRGAGTVEFLFDGSAFYFMEMNTRLQVEHPVTESITGFDLVAWQIAVAQGEGLPAKQKDITCQGHSIEVRVYAEDPQDDFKPATGDVLAMTLPCGNGVRIDAGVDAGDTVSPFYDAMIAKVIATGDSRDEALDILAEALEQTHILGVTHNLNYLRKIVALNSFQDGTMTTHTLANESKLIQEDKNTKLSFKLACAVLVYHQQTVQDETLLNSPWGALDNWRLGGTEPFHVELVKLGGKDEEGLLSCLYKGDYLYLDGMLCDVEELSGNGWEGLYAITLSGQRYDCHVLIADGLISVLHDGEQFTYKDKVMQAELEDVVLTDGRIVSPLPGVVAKVVTEKGQTVKEGDALIIIEAMKTEHTLQAPFDGTIAEVHYHAGDYVEKDAELLSFEDKS